MYAEARRDSEVDDESSGFKFTEVSSLLFCKTNMPNDGMWTAVTSQAPKHLAIDEIRENVFNSV